MKRLLTLTVLMLLAWLVMAAAPKPVPLAWDYNEPNPDCFKLYSATNLDEPLTNWVVLLTLDGTNRACTVAVEPGRRFFYLSASNYWGEGKRVGESDPSNIVDLPSLVGTNKLRIMK